MRDLGITVLVAILIVFAGIRFSGYQNQLALQKSGMLSDDTSAAVIDANGDTDGDMAPTTPVTSKSPVSIPDKEPVSSLSSDASAAIASLSVKDQKAGSTVVVDSVFVPEGTAWVAVHEGTRTLGVLLFGKGKGSGTVELLRPTAAGKTYTISLHKDNGDGNYSRATDLEIKDASGKPVQVMMKAL